MILYKVVVSVFVAEAAAVAACPLRGDGVAPAAAQPEDHRGCEER